MKSKLSLAARRKASRLLRPVALPAGRFARDTLGIPPSALERIRAVALPADGPTLVEVRDVTPLPLDAGLLPGFALDHPFPGARSDIHALRFSGTVRGTDRSVRLELLHEGRAVGAAPVQAIDPANDKREQGNSCADQARFRLLLGTIGLPTDFKLRLKAVVADELRVPVALVRGKRQPIQTGYTPVLQPLLLWAIGRSGTTWLMRLLGEHPRIVVHRQYPYEVRAAAYWMHTFEVLAHPADPVESPRSGFANNRHWVGHNPFYSDTLGGPADMLDWFGRDQVQRLAAVCQQTIDDFYERVAAAQGQTQPVYFAEKFPVSNSLTTTGELYPNIRDLYLVRDFRDVVCSMLAFNAKRNRLGFGRKAGQEDEDYVRQLRSQQVDRLLDAWRRRSAGAHLVRYEDLVLRPEATLESLFASFDLDHDQPTVDGILRRAAEDSAKLRFHRTTSNPAASVGRWRGDLPAELQHTCATVLGDALAEFGYEV